MPSRATYPHQWNWDSALAALGWAELDPGRAWTELETLGGRARPARDDPAHRLPHPRPGPLGPRLRGLLTLVARPYARYLPGPRWWGRRLAPTAGASRGSPSRRWRPPARACCSRTTPTSAARAALLEPLHALAPLPARGARPARPRRAGADPPVGVGPRQRGRVGRPALARHARGDGRAPARHRLGRRRRAAHRRALPALPDPGAPGHGRRLGPGAPGRERRASACSTPASRRSSPAARADLAWLAEPLGEAAHRGREPRRISERVAAALRARADSDGLIRPVDAVDGPTLARDERRLGAGAAHARAGRAELAGRARPRHGRRAGVGLRRALARPGAPGALGRATTGAGRSGRTSPGCARSRSSATASEPPPRTLRRAHAAGGRTAAGCASTARPSRAAAWARATSAWTAALCLRAA